jgi:Tol biopolymer transport system component
MKHCPKCGRSYSDETLNFCLEDGEWLTELPQADEPATAVLSEGISAPGKTTLERETQIYTSGDFVANELKGHKLRSAVIATVGLIVLAGFVYGIYKFFGEKAKPPERSNAAMTTTRLTGDGKVREAAISPDGKYLAYVRLDGADRSVWLKQIQTNTNIQVVKPGELVDFYAFTFSPDGNFLYFNASVPNDAAAIYRVPSIGGSPTKVIPLAYAIQFAPDGKQISYIRFDVSTSTGGVYIANTDGSKERKLVGRGGTQFIVARPAWSPDGKWIAIVEGDDAKLPEPNLGITLISTETGDEKTLGGKWFLLDDIAWHPSGDSLLLIGTDNTQAANQLWEVSYLDGARRRLTNNLNGHTSISITADGNSVVTGELYARSAIWVSPDTKAENAKAVMPATADTWGLAWTPDNRIVFASDQTGNIEIWIMDADGANSKALTNDRFFKGIPVVSPDGRYIVFTSSLNNGNLIRIYINGGNQFVYDIQSADNPDISSDSKWVIYSAWIGGQQKIFRVPIEGGEPQQLTPDSMRVTEPRYSHDGSRFACFVNNDKTSVYDQLAIFPAEGGDPIKTFKLPPNVYISRGPVWTPDDKGITMIVAPGELQNLWVQPIEGGDPKQITNFQLPGIARRDYSRDGKRIAIVRAEGFGNAIMISNFR